MNRDYHSKSKHPPTILLRDAKVELQHVTKVGIIPFIPHEELRLWQFKLMKPHAEHGHPTGSSPEYQIAKGTRRINMGGGWCDMRDDDLINADPVFYENLVETALREGEEEIGLKRGNIVRLYDVGIYSITSARRQIQKPLHVYAAEIKEADDFGAFESKTAEVVWMRPEQLEKGVRPDHAIILKGAFDRLSAALR